MTRSKRFEILAWREALASCSREWAGIVHSRRLNPTLGPDWSAIIIASLASDHDLRVLSDRADGVLNGVVPYFFRHRRMLGIPVNVLECSSNLISYHAELVCRHDPTEMLEALISGTRGWHVLRAGNLLAGGLTALAIEEVARRTGSDIVTYPAANSPYLPVAGTWDEYLAARGKKFRYKLRKRKESLTEGDSLDMRWFDAMEDVDRLMQDILEIEKRSWKADSGIAISDREEEQRYHKLLLPFLAERGALMANVLYHRNQPIAYNLCCDWDGWIGQLKTSFCRAYSEISPGSVVIDAAVEEAFRRQGSEFDFLGDADQHKLKWTEHMRQHIDYYLFRRRTRGQVIGLIQKLRRRAEDQRKQ